jgi:hypothetical protein
MKKFLIQLSLFLTIVIALNYIYIFYIDNLPQNAKSSKNAIFIWGDSQTCQGLNLKMMKELTGKYIYSSAKHGAGIYDFLVFADKVPENSTVLVAISKPVQLRKLNKDRNLSGTSLFSLIQLYENNYSSSDIYSIFQKNLIPINFYEVSTKLNPCKDSLNYKSQILIYKNIFSQIPYYLNDKQNLYLEGIKKLKNKKCKINFIEFPLHPMAIELLNNSEVRDATNQLNTKILALFNNSTLDTIPIDNSTNIMSDFSHLNKCGANQITRLLIAKLNNNLNTTLYVTKFDPK